MADIMIEQPHNDSISAIESAGMRTTAPSIEMVPNPAFSFPMRAPESRRPTSMLLSPSPAVSQPHKRTASALPTFTFNAGDTSGRTDTTPPKTPDENTMDGFGTSARKGHRRGGSEFVGGDSRFGVNNAITSSPTKTDAPTLPVAVGPPAGWRHAHRRSVAVSSHDLSQIMTAGDKSPMLGGSLPTNLDIPPLPLAPLFTSISAEEPRRAQVEDSPTRPPSRPRVEFVEQVEFIPRPLSTISSETESSVSTVMGHSVSNSINSVLSLRSPSHNRVSSAAINTLGSIPEPQVQSDKRFEKEGDWLKNRPVSQDSQHVLTQAEAAPTVEPAVAEPMVHKRQKRQSVGQTFGFERRRSEPLISIMTEQTRLSALSLQDIMSQDTDLPLPEKRSSGQKLKQWALSKLQRRHRDIRPQTAPLGGTTARPETAGSVDASSQASSHRVVAETNLDAVFGSSSVESSPLRYGKSPTQMTFEQPSPALDGRHRDSDDDASPMLDLDAALEPLSAKPYASGSHRRHMHSDRPSSASHFLHRRAESEPVLMAFNYNRTGSTPQKSMEDVFEEEEDDALTGEEAGMGVTMVDADRSAFDPANLERQRMRRAARDSDRPFTSYITPSSTLTVPLTSGRPASIVDDIIAEEASPIEIVQAHEEPRAASLEKSSDSSEVSTLLAAPILALADEHGEALSPESFNDSSFSSPDFSRRQGSFEASRVGTSASSLADTRTTSSCTTGEPGHEVRMSVDDVPSLTSSRSTMMSILHAENRRSVSESRVYEAIPRQLDPDRVAAHRKKRASIQSLSQLVGGTFGAKPRGHDESRPQTANLHGTDATGGKTKKKEHRLKKLMFWRSKQNLRQAARDDAATEI